MGCVLGWGAVKMQRNGVNTGGKMQLIIGEIAINRRGDL